MKAFGRLRFQEFAPRRNIEEEIADFKFRATRERDVANVQHTAAADLDFRAGQIARGLGSQPNLGYRRDRSQRLAAEAERRDRFQIVCRLDLTRGVALESEDC